jgi:hypothetical protein
MYLGDLMKCVPEFKGCGCMCSRSFYTKEEKLTHLEEYKNNLKKELEGIEARIEELKNN